MGWSTSRKIVAAAKNLIQVLTQYGGGEEIWDSFREYAKQGDPVAKALIDLYDAVKSA